MLLRMAKESWKYGSLFPPLLHNTLNQKESHDTSEEGGVGLSEKVKVKRPKRYKVVLHNDDYTTMEFVVIVLQKFFFKTMEEANQIMLKVHNEGKGICGIYTYEVAESKAQDVIRYAQEHEQPLKCTVESE